MKSDVKYPKLTALQRQLKNINKKSLRAGSKLLLNALRGRVPTRFGALKKSLASKVDTFRGEVIAYSIVGPRSNYLQAVGGHVAKPSRYAHLVESGRFARPFLAPTWQSTKSAAIAEVERVTAQEINKIIGGA